MNHETTPSPDWSWLSPWDRLELDIAALRVEVEYQRGEIAELGRIVRGWDAARTEDEQ